MRAKSIVLLMLALGCGLVASIGITQAIQKDARPPEPEGDSVAIFVATKDIAAWELLTAQSVKLETWPKDKVFEDCLGKIEEIEGCRARTEILAGDPIRSKKLLGKGATQQTPADHIRKGYRLVAVKVNLVSGAGLIRPGDRVDVMVHLQANRHKGIFETTTRTILQDVKVFAVNDIFKLASAGDEEDSIAAKTISLEVTPEQAEKVMLATQLGTVQLVMRGPADKDIVRTGGASPSLLLGPTGANEREKLPVEADKPKGGGLLGLLQSMRSEPAAPPPPVMQPPAEPAQPESFTVRLLEGPDVSEVILEHAPDASSSGWGSWRLGSPNSGSGGHYTPAPVPGNQPEADQNEPEDQDVPEEEDDVMDTD